MITLFLMGPRISTLPVEIFHSVETRADPLVAAVSVILILLTLAVVLVVDRTLALGRTLARRSRLRARILMRLAHDLLFP